MAQRKTTIKISEIVTIANRLLAKSFGDASETRTGISNLLCEILEQTNNYDGFKYLRQNEVPTGELPGIIFDSSPEHNHQFPDDTRRMYFCKSK